LEGRQEEIMNKSPPIKTILLRERRAGELKNISLELKLIAGYRVYRIGQIQGKVLYLTALTNAHPKIGGVCFYYT